jgi:hypothetical protein
MTVKYRNPAASLFSEFYTIDKRVFFILVCLIAFLLLFLKKSLIESQIAAFEILEERGQMGIYHAVNALQYFTIPVIYLYKFTLTAFILWVGCFTWGYKVYFNRLWQLVMLAECIFFLAEFTKIGWFLLGSSDPDIWEVRAFYPFSLMNLFDYQQLNAAWHYPLKALNLFEVLYWVILVLGIQYLSGKKLSVSIYIVLSFYVFWFLLWLGFYIIVYK